MRRAVTVLLGVCGCWLVGGCGGATTSGPATTYVNAPTRIYRIPSSAMEPTLHCAKPAPGCLATVDDRVLVRMSGSAHLRRGSIIVFGGPPKAAAVCGEGGTFVQRIVGLPRETVHENGHGFIYVDGKRLSEPDVTPSRRLADVTDFNKTWHVSATGYFVVGDNRAESCDSRGWGSVPQRNVIGQVVQIIRTR